MTPRKRKAVPDGATGLLFRALLQNEIAEWAQMPFITRACAVQLMRRLDANNEIVCAPGKTPYDAVYSVFGVQATERRRVREAIDELVAGRWMTLSSDRLTAHFPDLGGVRASFSSSKPSEPLTTDAENGSAVEESRVEEKREEESRAPDARPTHLRWDPAPIPDGVFSDTDKRLRDELATHQIAFTEMVCGAKMYHSIVYWVIDHVKLLKIPVTDVIRFTAYGFAKNAKAAREGHACSWLATNPRQYFEEGKRLLMNTTAEAYDDEEHPL